MGKAIVTGAASLGEPRIEAIRQVGEPVPVPTTDVDFVELETVA
ncbi:MAG: hypothetical protein ABSH56_36715 [Bryobacteraceae bacterium]|jgi:hypothetical protein